ncbi:hypothetical protein OROMI_005960 [Orobanche minor]
MSRISHVIPLSAIEKSTKFHSVQGFQKMFSHLFLSRNFFLIQIAKRVYPKTLIRVMSLMSLV